MEWRGSKNGKPSDVCSAAILTGDSKDHDEGASTGDRK
jgi:hypothetical protein